MLFCFEVMVSHSLLLFKESLTSEALSSIENSAGRTLKRARVMPSRLELGYREI